MTFLCQDVALYCHHMTFECKYMQFKCHDITFDCLMDSVYDIIKSSMWNYNVRLYGLLTSRYGNNIAGDGTI